MKNRFVAFAAALFFAAFIFGITACSELFEEKDVYPQMESLVVADGSPVVSPDQDDKTVTVSDEKVLSAEINEEGKLVITPLKPGSAEVSFFDSENNTYVTYEFEVTSKGQLVQSSEPKSVKFYSITIQESENGSVSATPVQAVEGSTVTLTARADDGYRLGTYTVTSGGQAVSVSDNTFTMPAGNVTVTATFTAIDYTVSISAMTHGSVTADKTTANAGDTVTLTANPDAGYQLGAYTVTSGENPVTVSANTFTMPAGNVMITATFTAIDYTVSISAITHGSVEADKTSAHAGDTVTLTARADDGYQFGTYTVTSGGQAVAVSDNTFTMPAGNVTVTATFIPRTYGVGDVLLKDGSIIYYENVASMTAEQKENAVGVLYALDENDNPRGWLGVYNSIQKVTYCWLAWAKALTTGENTKFEDIICTPSTSGEGAASTATFTGDTDGSDNWAYICSIDPTASANAEENYPGFHYVNTYAQTFNLTGVYADGWYMPSIAELCYIYRNKDAVNEVITALGGTTLKDQGYLSSSQSTTTDSVWHINLDNGSLSKTGKWINPLICCVRKFTEGD